MTSINHNKEFLGIDIGSASIKALRLELTQEGLSISERFNVALPTPVVRSDKTIASGEIIKVLAQVKQMLTKNIRNTHACISIPGFMTETRFASIPESTNHEFNKILNSECQTYCDPDSYIFGAKIIERRGNFRKDPDKSRWQRDVLLMMTEKNVLASYYDLAEQLQLPNVVFSIDVLGMVKALACEKGVNVIIHVGAMTTSIVVAKAGKVIFLRHILNDKDKGLIENTCFEVKRSIDYFCENSRIETIDRILASGGQGIDKAMVAGLSEVLKLPVTCADFLPPLISAQKKEFEIDAHVYAVSLGMAMVAHQGWEAAKLEAGLF